MTLRSKSKKEREEKETKNEESSSKTDDKKESADVSHHFAFSTPITFKQAIRSPESGKWKEAMEKEMNSHKENQTWTLVEPPKNRTTVSNKWVYVIKENLKGEKKFKARLVARGFTQKPGIDYDDAIFPLACSSKDSGNSK